MSDRYSSLHMRREKFYMYTGPHLDHSWLRHCKGFATLRYSVNDSNTAEVGVHKVWPSA